MTECKHCGRALPEGASFCPDCGAKVRLNPCPGCGREIPLSASFCSHCGAPILKQGALDPIPGFAGADDPRPELEGKEGNMEAKEEPSVPVASPEDRSLRFRRFFGRQLLAWAFLWLVQGAGFFLAGRNWYSHYRWYLGESCQIYALGLAALALLTLLIWQRTKGGKGWAVRVFAALLAIELVGGGYISTVLGDYMDLEMGPALLIALTAAAGKAGLLALDLAWAKDSGLFEKKPCQKKEKKAKKARKIEKANKDEAA